MNHEVVIVLRSSGSPIVYLAVNASESFPVGLPRPVIRLRLTNLLCKDNGKEAIRSDSSNLRRQFIICFKGMRIRFSEHVDKGHEETVERSCVCFQVIYRGHRIGRYHNSD